jgi:fumarylacetoacetase
MASYNPNDQSLRSWVSMEPAHDFPIQNLPLGIFVTGTGDPRPGVAIGDSVLDLAELGLLEGGSLNEFFARGRTGWRTLRQQVSWLLNKDNPELRDDASRIRRSLLPQSAVEMRLPAAIGDYVDFYSSLEHATNVGKMFRDPTNPLLPNWRWLPIGYHGRAGTVAVSGTPVRRPCGQLTRDNETASFGPSRRLDIELELAFFTGAPSLRGIPVAIDESEERIAGIVLMNDWSARDIQRWEYVPLGPFLGKSFLTSVSPWVISLDSLEPFRAPGPPQQPETLPYLRQAEPRNYDIHLEVLLQPAGSAAATRVCRTNYRHMYWSMAQQLAHLTSNGATIRPGDLCGSGTISGPGTDSFGSLLELSWNGTRPLRFPGGIERTFLEDGDTVILRGWCENGSTRIGLGEVRGTILPA